MSKTGFVFDLDGVIVDTAKYHYLAWKKLANELGFEFTKEQNEMFKGVSRKRCLEILLDIGNIKASQVQFDTWMIDKNVDYLAYIENMDDSEVLPDVPRVLKYLKENNIPIALGSASKNAQPILEKNNIWICCFFCYLSSFFLIVSIISSKVNDLLKSVVMTLNTLICSSKTKAPPKLELQIHIIFKHLSIELFDSPLIDSEISASLSSVFVAIALCM